MQGAWCRTRSWDSSITPWAKGRRSTAEPPRRLVNSVVLRMGSKLVLNIWWKNMDWRLKYFTFYLSIYYNKAGGKTHKKTTFKFNFPKIVLSLFSSLTIYSLVLFLWMCQHGCLTNQSDLSFLNFLFKSLPLMHSNYHYYANALQIMSFPDPFQVPISH